MGESCCRINGFLVIAAGSVGAYAFVKLNNASKEAHVSLARGEQSVKRIKEFDPGKILFLYCS